MAFQTSTAKFMTEQQFAVLKRSICRVWDEVGSDLPDIEDCDAPNEEALEVCIERLDGEAAAIVNEVLKNNTWTDVLTALSKRIALA